jgi:hypothetical protein
MPQALLGILPLALAMAWGPCAAADPDAAAPSLELFPTKITASLSPDRPLGVDVSLKAGGTVLSNVSISTFSNEDIAVAPVSEQLKLDHLAANAAHAWHLELTHRDGILGAATLYVRAEFDAADHAGKPVHQILHGSTEIAAGADSTTPLKAEFVETTTTVAQKRASELLLKITNQSAQGLQLLTATLVKPNFLQFATAADTASRPSGTSVSPPVSPAAATKSASGEASCQGSIADRAVLSLGARPVAPAEAVVVPIVVTACALVVPGKYPVVAQIQAVSGRARQTAIAQQDIQLEVQGESSLLTLLGIPSLLFLPGALVVTTFLIVWSIGKTSDARKDFVLQPATSQFWVVAVALSLLAAILYPYLTRIFPGESRDYLVSYGFEDFAYIYGWAIAVGLAAFVAFRAVAGFKRLWSYLRAKWHAPQVGDRPLPILQKLGNLKKDISCRQMYSVGGNQEGALLVLEPWSTESEVWLVPPATLTLTLPPDHAKYYDAIDAQDRIVSGQVTDAASVAHQIREGEEAGWWTIAWRPVGAVQSTVKEKPSAWALLPNRALIVRR